MVSFLLPFFPLQSADSSSLQMRGGQPSCLTVSACCPPMMGHGGSSSFMTKDRWAWCWPKQAMQHLSALAVPREMYHPSSWCPAQGFRQHPSDSRAPFHKALVPERLQPQYHRPSVWRQSHLQTYLNWEQDVGRVPTSSLPSSSSSCHFSLILFPQFSYAL